MPQTPGWLNAVVGPLASVLVGALVGGSGCVCTSGPPPQIGKDFGALGAGSALTPDGGAAAGAAAFSLLAFCRGVIANGKRGDVAWPASAFPASAVGPQRVALALWAPGADPHVSVVTRQGASLEAAVTSAAEALASQAGATVAVRAGRLEVDLPVSATSEDLGRDRDEPLSALGLEGLLVARDDGKAAAVLPGEIIDSRLYREGRSSGLDRSRVRALLATRAGVDEPDLETMRAYRFKADAFVESSAHDAALPLVRGMVSRPADPTPDRLLAAVRRGADYLVRAINREGRYAWMVHALDDRDDTAYGWLQHAGTTYALFEAFEELHTPLYADRGELALSYLRSHLRYDPDSQGSFIASGTDEEQEKSGGAGIALVAFAKHAATTGKRTELETMRGLARFILKQQYADGHFRMNADLATGGQRLKKEVWYYPGEATLGLMRLYAIDPQPAYLDGARRAADWVIRVRDGATSEDNQEHDHWMSYALNELYRVTHEESYFEHAMKIARAIRRKERGVGPESPAPDLAGSFSGDYTTPAATRLEAFTADLALARFAARPDEASWLPTLMGSAKTIATFTLAQQFDPDNAYWLRNPARAEGGVRESPYAADVRIDYVQHALSGWLHLARLLRDPDYGKTGAPSQDPIH